jgi:hypothetical protein
LLLLLLLLLLLVVVVWEGVGGMVQRATLPSKCFRRSCSVSFSARRNETTCAQWWLSRHVRFS